VATGDIGSVWLWAYMDKATRYLPGDARHAATRHGALVGSRNSRTSIDSQMEEEPAAPTLVTSALAVTKGVLLLAIVAAAAYCGGLHVGRRTEAAQVTARPLVPELSGDRRASRADGQPLQPQPSTLQQQEEDPPPPHRQQHAMRNERAKMERGRRLLDLGRGPMPPPQSDTSVKSALLAILCFGHPVYTTGYVGWGSPGLFSMLNSVADE
jgi:hypothetical protein